MVNPPDLGVWQWLPLGGLLLVMGGLSLLFQLDQGKALFWATFRMVVQLTLVGLALHWIFAVQHWVWMGLWAAFATGVAAYSASTRVTERYQKMLWDLLAALVVGAWLVVGYGLLVVVKPTPWFSPQFLVPLLGMVLGNMLNGLSLGMDHFLKDCRNHRDAIETVLALGGTRWEAARPWFREGLRYGMVPILNAMTVAGVVSLPGMMTGQILAGAPVIQAVKYQILILVLILTATTLGTAISLGLAYSRLFPPTHRLALEKL